ncbi:hypothetical protein F443_10531, partial [Plasmopara halstedii]
MLRLKIISVLVAVRRSSRLQTVCAMSTNHGVDDKAFLKSISKEQAKRALDRSVAIRADHIAAKGDFPPTS